MTCAGIASVIISGSRLDSDAAGNQIQCCGGSTTDELAIENGVQWLGRNFNLEVNPGGDSLTKFYYLYALERVGRLSGRRFMGEHDWYREGADRIVGVDAQAGRDLHGRPAHLDRFEPGVLDQGARGGESDATATYSRTSNLRPRTSAVRCT